MDILSSKPTAAAIPYQTVTVETSGSIGLLLKSAHTWNEVNQLNFFLIENQNLSTFWSTWVLDLSLQVQACWLKTLYI